MIKLASEPTEFIIGKTYYFKHPDKQPKTHKVKEDSMGIMRKAAKICYENNVGVLVKKVNIKRSGIDRHFINVHIHTMLAPLMHLVISEYAYVMSRAFDAGWSIDWFENSSTADGLEYD